MNGDNELQFLRELLKESPESVESLIRAAGMSSHLSESMNKLQVLVKLDSKSLTPDRVEFVCEVFRLSSKAADSFIRAARILKDSADPDYLESSAFLINGAPLDSREKLMTLAHFPDSQSLTLEQRIQATRVAAYLTPYLPAAR